MNKIRLRKKYQLSRILIGVIFLIIFFTICLFNIYNKKVSPKIIDVAEAKINKFIKSFLSNNISHDILDQESLENILIINKNNEDEILYVDFNLDKAYIVLEKVSKELNHLISDLEQGKFADIKDNNIKVNKNGLILEYPLFMSSNYALLSNLGPKIYIKVNFIGTMLTNIKSKITEYGINNALVELYVTIEVSQELISPVTDNEISLEYDVLIASQVINGTVPEFYGGIITEKSTALSIPLE